MQLALAARVAGLIGQLLVCLKSALPVVMLEIVSGNDEEPFAWWAEPAPLGRDYSSVGPFANR